MNRAQILLIAIVASAVVAGVFAFKAKRIPVIFYKLNTTTDPAQRVCTVTTIVPYTTVEADKVPGAPTIVQTVYYSTAVQGPCPLLTIWGYF